MMSRKLNCFISSINHHKILVKQYKNVVEGLGCTEGEYIIEVDKDIKPVVTPCRKIPFQLQKKLQRELKRMEEQSVICKEENGLMA